MTVVALLYDRCGTTYVDSTFALSARTAAHINIADIQTFVPLLQQRDTAPDNSALKDDAVANFKAGGILAEIECARRVQ
jgi:hypothetical protein